MRPCLCRLLLALPVAPAPQPAARPFPDTLLLLASRLRPFTSVFISRCASPSTVPTAWRSCPRVLSSPLWEPLVRRILLVPAKVLQFDVETACKPQTHVRLAMARRGFQYGLQFEVSGEILAQERLKAVLAQADLRVC